MPCKHQVQYPGTRIQELNAHGTLGKCGYSTSKPNPRSIRILPRPWMGCGPYVHSNKRGTSLNKTLDCSTLRNDHSICFMLKELVEFRARCCRRLFGYHPHCFSRGACSIRWTAVLLGVAMVSVVSFSQTLSSFMNYRTSIETSLGATARIRRFVAKTPAELSDKAAIASAEWPSDTSIEFKDVFASYQYV